MKKKLLFVYDKMMTGGTTTAMISLLNSLDRDKYDIDLMLYKNGGEFFDKIPKHINVLPEAAKKLIIPEVPLKLLISVFNGQLFRAFYYYFKNRNNKSKSLKMAVWQATEVAHANISRKLEKEYDAVGGCIESWGAHYAVSNRVKAKKRIIFIHLDVNKSYLIPQIDKRMYKKADSIVTISTECCNNLKKALQSEKEKIKYIENITDIKGIKERAEQEVEFTPENNKINLVTVCRLNYNHKGLDRVLNAMKHLKEEGLLKGIVWYLIGNGECKNDMESFINSNGLQEFVVFLGEQKNPFPFLKKMDAFLLPSRFEGKPIAITEAQILGLPCFVTEYASSREQINSGVDGIIMQNSDGAVYQFLKQLCIGMVDIDELKKNVLLKDFSQEKIIKETEELFL